MASNSSDLNIDSVENNDKFDELTNYLNKAAEKVENSDITSNSSELNKYAEIVENSDKAESVFVSDLRDDGSVLSDTFTDDLYDDIDELWPRLRPATNSVITSSPRLSELNPQDIALYDSKHESVILSETNALHKSLYFCDKIVDACFKIASYVPDLTIEQNSAFWTNDVIPIITTNVKNVNQGRVIVSKSIASVRQLGISIFRGAQIIYDTRGSLTALKIARTNISASLASLDKRIAEIEKLEVFVSNDFFENQIDKIFKIIGPEAANFVKDISDIETQIHAAEERQMKRLILFERKKVEVAHLKHLVSAARKYSTRYFIRNLETNDGRTEAPGESNEETDHTIPNTQASTSNNSTQWWGFWSNSKDTTTASRDEDREELSGRDRESDYYDSMMRARIRQLVADKTVNHTLNDELSKYTDKLTEAEAQLTSMGKNLETHTRNSEKDIMILNGKLKSVKDQQRNIERTIGLQGHTLIQCVTDIRTFGKTIEKQTSAFSPLVGILGDIRQLVQSDIQLLLSESESDITVAASRLMKQVQFLSNYAVNADKMLTEASPFTTLAIEDCEEAVEITEEAVDISEAAAPKLDDVAEIKKGSGEEDLAN